ncbi:MAG: tRNA (mo5U34)-methyltransferase [Chlamydiae bacterium]|nr:tRNA (mo5U34)-methyltransferase [Chlamydiota bacterium]
MRFKLLTFLVCFCIFSDQTVFGHPAMKRLKYGRDWAYQSIIVNGDEIFKSINASGGSWIIYDRYEAIKSVLKQYNRPFTVLDLGANNGFFSIKIAEDFDAVCVMIDGSERLTDICTLNTERNKIIHFQKHFNHAEIVELSKQEHFDVILALHVLHHVDNWRGWVDTLFQMGDNVIIETPSADDPINKFEHTKQLARYLTSLPNAVQIGAFPRHDKFDHMLWFCQNNNGFNQAPFRLGIKPTSFFKFNGRFPTQSYVHELDGIIKNQCGDVSWVLQGVDYTLDQ